LVGNLINIPLLYRYAPEIKNAKIQVEQKELMYNSTLHLAQMNLHTAYDSFITAQMNLNYYNDVILSESNQFLNMAKKSYTVGKTNMTELLYIEQSYKSIIMGYTNALATYYNSWVDVLREVNDEEFKLNG
jgi:outer membrane protein, heavy metal efflux system